MHPPASQRQQRALPAPDQESLARSETLAGLIRTTIEAEGGSIGFQRYMELALYAPGLGYYRAGADIFGSGGDFVTAPEISALFGQCVAAQCAEILNGVVDGDILEFGAGSGKLAFDILRTLATEGALPKRYLILELSAALRRRQEELLLQLPEEIRSRIVWLDALPDAEFCGIVLANEVLDAMPVRVFAKRLDACMERRVTIRENGFGWIEQEADSELFLAITAIERDLGRALPASYCSEVNPWLAPWMCSLSERLARGALLLFDYGYPRREYYLPERCMGTLVCHYRHRAHDDPFLHPGLQDLSASVDFTAVAGAGALAGLELLGYTSQAQFLLGTGIADGENTGRMQGFKRLMLPGEMGERFQVMALGRNLPIPLRGFAAPDWRHRL